MRGTITSAVNVYGERRGQRVTRQWVFSALCSTSICSRVRLTRQRSDRGITDALVLKRVGRGTYSGTGRFWVALRCGGRVISRGGLAAERIVVRIRRTQTSGSIPFASALTASYQNLYRLNLTACPGGIGHDAAAYSGTRASPPSGGGAPARRS